MSRSLLWRHCFADCRRLFKQPQKSVGPSICNANKESLLHYWQKNIRISGKRLTILYKKNEAIFSKSLQKF